MKLEKSVRFFDAEGREVEFVLTGAGAVAYYVDGRQKVNPVRKLHAEGWTLHVDGKRLMTSECTARVPRGEDALVGRIMELYGRRRREGTRISFPPINVKIEGARGLRNADGLPGQGLSDPYCTCEVPYKPCSKFATSVVNDTLEPQWDHLAEVAEYTAGDSLLFTVWDKDWDRDDLLGYAILTLSEEAYTSGFDGELRLLEAGDGIDAHLKVVVAFPKFHAAGEDLMQKARDQVEAACSVRDCAALSMAIEDAKAVRLRLSEYTKAEALLHELELQMALLSLRKTMQGAENIDLSDMAGSMGMREQLRHSIRSARTLDAPEAELLKAETLRKQIHKAADTLKGSLRVFCRVRPLVKKEQDAGAHTLIRKLGPMTLQMDHTMGCPTAKQAAHRFKFDSVFTPGTQEEVFADCRDLVRSAVDGDHVALMAFGPTGAGKTFTLRGVPGKGGIAPRTFKEIYVVMESSKEQREFIVSASMLELHCDGVVDLLVTDALAADVHVRHSVTDGLRISSLAEVVCHSAEGLSRLYKRGNKHRAARAIAVKLGSSRSHVFLIINIVAINHVTKEKTRGKILICDLAGSDSLTKPKRHDDCEGGPCATNRSLTALGDVVDAIARNDTVIPYGNHTLTQIMQDSLGGSAKAVVFLSCSPSSSQRDETLQTLKFGARAKGKARGELQQQSANTL